MSSADVLFRDRDFYIIREICPETKKEIIFKINKADYEAAAKKGFPATWESEAYGSPMYRLQIVTNSALQVIKKQAVPVLDVSKEKSLSMDLTAKVLSNLNLTEKEITTYFLISGRGPIDAGEIMLLIDESKTNAMDIANKLVKMGLARKIVGATDYWEALPPYAALVKQQEMFANEVQKLKETTMSALDERFAHFEQSTGGIRKLRDFQDFILKTSSEFSNKMDEFNQRKSEITQSSKKGIDELKDFQSFITTLGTGLSKQIEEQDKMLHANTKFFDQLKTQNNANLEGIKEIINDIRSKRDNVEKELDERFQKLSGTAQAQLTTQFQGLVSQFSELNNTVNQVIKRVGNAVGKMRLGPTTTRIQQVVKATLQDSFSKIEQSVVAIQQSFIDNFHQNFNQIIRVNLANFSSTIQGLLIDVVEQVEKIQQTNNNIVNNVKATIDNVSDALKDSFKKTSNAFNDTIKDAENKMGMVATQLEGMLETIINEFERVFSDVLQDFSDSAEESKKRAEALSGEIDVALNTIRDVFKGEVVKELEKILGNMEDRVEESQRTIMDFWERAKSEVMYSLKEVWFVRSPEAVISAINESLLEAKMRVLIIAPTLDDVDIRPLLESKKSTNIRLACAIDPGNDKHLAILSVLDEHPNISYRHYKGEVTIWGVNRDFEKCVVAVVSKSKEVAGIGTVLEEDIRLFTPILEECWRNGRKEVFDGIERREVQATEEDLVFKPTHKTYYSMPKIGAKAKVSPDIIRTRTEIQDSTAETGPATETTTPEREEPATKVEPTTTASTVESVSSAGISPLFMNPPDDLNTFIKEGVKELERLTEIQTGNSLADNVEKFRKEIFNKIGFNSTLFELARAVRELNKIPGTLNGTQQQQFKDRFRMWQSKLLA
ncbi:hypothetical protein GF325_16530 [Candidatus Bathyarchaeota archaeon]|nr:hypothetical protein [Candidatus Bathyarchaeota archaeon]